MSSQSLLSQSIDNEQEKKKYWESLWNNNLKQKASIPFNFRILSHFSFSDYHLIDQYGGANFHRVSNGHNPSWVSLPYEPNLKFEAESTWQSGLQIKFSWGINFLEQDTSSLRFGLANEYFIRLQYMENWGIIRLDLGGPVWRNWSIMTLSGSLGDSLSDHPFERQSWHSIHAPVTYRKLTQRVDAQDLSREGQAIALMGISADLDVTTWGFYAGGFYGSTENEGIFFNEFKSSSSISLYALEKRLGRHFFGHIVKLYDLKPEGKTQPTQENDVFSGYYGMKDKTIGNFYLEYAASLVRGNELAETLGHSLLATYENNFSDLNIPVIKDLRLGISFYYTDKNFISEYSGVKHTKTVSNYIISNGNEFEEKNHLYNNRLGFKVSLTYANRPYLFNLFYRYAQTLEPVDNRFDYSHELNDQIWNFIHGDFPYAGDDDNITTSLRDHRGGNNESIFLTGFQDANNSHRTFDQIRLTLGFDISHYLPF